MLPRDYRFIIDVTEKMQTPATTPRLTRHVDVYIDGIKPADDPTAKAQARRYAARLAGLFDGMQCPCTSVVHEQGKGAL